MRTRQRTGFDPKLPVTGGFTSEYNTFYQEVQDVNNGRTRPESPCDMVKSWVTPNNSPLFKVDHSEAGQYIHYPAFAHARFCRDLARQKMRDFEGLAKSRILERELLLSKRFSAINFFLELKEVGSMAKALDRYRYVDWSFGIAPFIDDIKNISTRFDSSIAAINSRLDAYSRPVPISLAQTYHIGATDVLGVYPSTYTEIDFQGEVKCAFNGTLHVELPILSRYNRDYTIWLDQIGLHPDLSTVWEAVPFSWMIDWFVPIGNYLEGLSESWLSPQLIFNGSSHCTYTFSGSHTVKSSPLVNQGYLPDDWRKGQHIADSFTTGYIRAPLVEHELTVKRKEFKLSLGLDSLHKTALLSDIFGPSRAPEKRSKSREKFIRAYDKLSYPFQKGQKVRKK